MSKDDYVYRVSLTIDTGMAGMQHHFFYNKKKDADKAYKKATPFITKKFTNDPDKQLLTLTDDFGEATVDGDKVSAVWINNMEEQTEVLGRFDLKRNEPFVQQNAEVVAAIVKGVLEAQAKT